MADPERPDSSESHTPSQADALAQVADDRVEAVDPHAAHRAGVLLRPAVHEVVED